MAVDKNFVVRNGLEVNSDLIVTDTSDSSNKKVGIASTAPRVTLDVRGGIAATDLNVTGVATLASVDVASYGRISGATQIDATSLNVTGITTLANVAITNVNISGVATFADITYDEISGRNLNLTGIATIPSQANLNVTGLATIPTISNTPSFSGGAVVTGVVTASQFSGDGSQLTGIGVGIKTTGGTIGFGFTTLNFIGSGNTFAVNGTTVDISIAGGGGGGSASIGIGTTVGDAFTGIVTAGNLWYNTGEGRLFIYYQDATSAQWIDAAPFNVGIITTLQDVAFAAGSAAAPAISFDTDSDSGFFQAAVNQPGVSAAGSQVARFNPGGLTVTGVVTATSFVGSGEGLTGVASTDNIQTATPAKFLSDVSITGVTTVGVVTGGTSVSATHFYGNGAALTGIDATSLKDSGGNIKAQANPNGVIITGILTATDVDSTSDVRLKTNIQVVDGALDKVNKLRGVSFDWKESGESSYGVIAQELESVLPELVHGDDPKRVNYNGIIGVLIESIKELSEKVRDLESGNN